MLHLKEIRKRSGKTQQEVADYLKIHRASYTNIENNKRNPETYIIIALSEYFNCSIDEIYGKAPIRNEELTEKQQMVIQLFDTMNDEGQEIIIQNLKFLISQGYIKSNKVGILSSKTLAK